MWIHAVSMGEVRALRALVPALLGMDAGFRILLTVTTPTGRAAAEALFQDRVEVRYVPLDLSTFISAVLTRRRPRALMLVEAELWPNLIMTASDFQLPIVLANARISERSARRFQRLAVLTRDLLRNLTLVLAQTDADAARFIALGVDAERVHVTGSLKFDRPEQASGPAQVMPRPLRLAVGCPRRGEEAIVVSALASLHHRLTGLSTVLVPRQVGDASFFLECLNAQGIPARLVAHCDVADWEPDQVTIVDVMGVLETVYEHARVAFVGGALVPLGGHSVADAAIAGCPVVTGPHHGNNRAAVEALVAAEAAQVVASAAQLEEVLADWLSDAELAMTVGQRAKDAIHRLAGASGRTLTALQTLGILDVDRERATDHGAG